MTFEFSDGSIGTVTYLANGDKAFSKERVEVFAGGRAAVLDDFRALEMGISYRSIRKETPANPLLGVFLTRSPDRPNPLGLHRVRVLAMEASSLLIGPIEAIDDTPVLDVKPVVEEADDF